MEKLKVAIVGCGRISACYKDAFLKLADRISVEYAVDKVEEKARDFAKDFSCRACTDIGEILDRDLDVVHLALPHFLHAPYSILLMRHGKNVLTEKPLAMTLQEADEMLKVEKESGKLLGCIFQTRYNASVQTLKKRLEEGIYGKIKTASSLLTWDRPDSYYEGSDWKGTWEYEGGGTIIDQAIHSIDRVRYIVGSDVEWVEASIFNRSHPCLSVEDTAEAMLQFRNGVKYHLFATNTNGYDTPIQIEFCAENGRFGLVQDMGYSYLQEKYEEFREVKPSVTIGKDYWGTTHVMQLEDFYRAILEGKNPLVTGLEGRKTLEIVKAIYLSAKYRKRISFPFTDEKLSAEEMRKLLFYPTN